MIFRVTRVIYLLVNMIASLNAFNIVYFTMIGEVYFTLIGVIHPLISLIALLMEFIA